MTHLRQVMVVAASAGTGKTTRLAKEIQERLLAAVDPIAPEHVVAVTYTRAAAAHLQARVRQALLQANAPELARRLAAARIGTVNAVCGRLIEDFALELGLSPELRVLDEALADTMARRVLEDEVGDDERALLDELGERFGDFDWARDVRAVMTLVRANDLDDEGLRASADASVASLLALLPAPEDVGAIEDALTPVLERVLSGPMPWGEEAREEHRELAEVRRTLGRGEALAWSQWWALERGRWDALRGLGRRHVGHPRLRQDLERATRLVFEIARRALDRYRDEKRRLGAVDFVDQEVETLRLLRDASVRDRLGEEVGLLLVDELQDTSPLQAAILSELASLSPRSLFVGDPKQAIFGFRGTDPALMHAVMSQLATGDDVLAVSWRSRPGLVSLTSQLFAPAFARQGLAPGHVQLQAALAHEPPGLGPFLERWTLTPGPPSPAEVAAGVAALLEDPSVRVREGGDIVPLQRRHIAVLAKKNRFARALAEELARLDIAAVLRRGGLCSTLEARALMAGLALFVDGRDGLAAAELARLTRGAADPGPWLTTLLQSPPGTAFQGEPLILAVIAAAQRHRHAGPVVAVDMVVEALRLRDVCVAWGDSGQRLANLGALRALAVRFVDECAARGGAPTVSGLLARLHQLSEPAPGEDPRDNQQGDVAAGDAVTVATWHGAKGREWPVVVLTQLDDAYRQSAFGVHLEPASAPVRLEDPLAGRRVRYWPKPYPARTWQGGLVERAEGSAAHRALQERADEEDLRLLYVGWTRARDRLVLCGGPPGHPRYDLWRGTQSLLRHLRDERGPLLSEPAEDGRARWAGVEVAVQQRTPRTRPAHAPAAGTARVPMPLPPQPPVPAWVQPSSLQGTGVAGPVHSLGAPLSLDDAPDEEGMTRLGSAVHAYLAATAGLESTARAALATAILDRFRVARLLSVTTLVEVGERMEAALGGLFPNARLRREVPIWHRRDDGSVVRGQIDLLVETPEGSAIVDHKTYVGLTDVAAGAAGFFGQLQAYGQALVAAGHVPLLGLYVHLPLQGALVRVSAPSPQA